MNAYTIEGFWKPRIGAIHVESDTLVKGWEFIQEGLRTFKEAPLLLSTALGTEVIPDETSIILISAPGAVGKTTLARQIACETGAIYVDLSKAEPVGGNTLSGGLVKSGVFVEWQENRTTVLIDGLDEARMRVTQEAYEAFLSDIVELSKGREKPTILFGRTGAIEYAWLVLSELNIQYCVLEIGYYNPEDAVEFAIARVQAARPDSPHSEVERNAVELLLQKLRSQTQSDGDRFAGYAPVLQAVADQVANEANTQALIESIMSGKELWTLHSVVQSVLNREREKLRPLQFEDPNLLDKLYSPEEQLDRLVAYRYQTSPPDLPHNMGHTDKKIYSEAISQWVPEHPFLYGGGREENPSTVFDAVISVRALKNDEAENVALERELGREMTTNPFLSFFYSENANPDSSGTGADFMPPRHIGLIYSSFRARLSLGDRANLSVYASRNDEEEETAVEFELNRREQDDLEFNFRSSQADAVLLGSRVEDVEIILPVGQVEIGAAGAEVTLSAPVNIECNQLGIRAGSIIVDNPSKEGFSSVFLEAERLDSLGLVESVSAKGNVEFAVCWPNSKVYPWTDFSTEFLAIEDQTVNEGLRRLRRFVIACRSRGQGNLAKFRGKMESPRMTKGSGQTVLQALLNRGILSIDGRMYVLNTNLLGEKFGMTYMDFQKYQFSAQAFDFVKSALGERD